MEDHEKKFIDNYEIKILNDKKRRARFSQFIPKVNDDFEQIYKTEIDSEKVYTLEIPESRLRALMEIEHRFYKYAQSDDARSLFYTIVDSLREEAALRKQYSAVTKAYEQYMASLGLVGYQRKY